MYGADMWSAAQGKYHQLLSLSPHPSLLAIASFVCSGEPARSRIVIRGSRLKVEFNIAKLIYLIPRVRL